MKNKSIGSLILLAILGPSCGGSGGNAAPPKPPNLVKWQTQQRVPTSSDLRSVIFADPYSGIIAGKDNTFFRTDDGGLTWVQQEIAPPQRTGDVAAMSALGFTLVAVGNDGANARSWVGTRDSSSWVTADAAGTPPAYVDVSVSDGGLGGNAGGTYWMLRSDGVIDYVFQSSGGTFTTVNANPTQPGCPQPPVLPVTWTQANGILFIGNTGTGFVCGTSGSYAGDPGCPSANPVIPPIPAHGPEGQIIVTTDFGTTWKPQNITSPTNIMSVVRRLIITQTQGGLARGYAIGDDTSNFGRLLVTNYEVPDSWDLVGNAPPNMPIFHGLSFPVNDLTGWVVGNNGTIYKVTAVAVFTPGTPPNPGVWTYTYTWTQQVSGVTENLWSISMLDNNNGYIVGDKGTVLKMTGGGPWTKISRGDAGVVFNAASFTDDGVKGIAVGDAGKIYRTVDGGANWTSLNSGTGANLLGAAVPRTGSGTTAYACGANGTLLRSPDVWTLGNWAPVTGTTAGDTYQSILFPQNENNGVCVGTANGGGPRLLRTSTGTAWAAPTTGPTLPGAQYNALAGNSSGSNVYASGGANGLVSLSSDGVNGWDTWGDLTPSPGGALTLFGIAAPEGGTYRAFAAASDNRVWRLSTPAPQTWSPTVNPWGAQNPVSLGFQGELSGITVLANGHVYYTVDGGASWSRSYPHTKDTPRAVWMTRAWGVAYIVANDGTILKTTTLGH